MNAALGRILERIPDLKVDPRSVKHPASIGIVKGLRSVEATFAPSTRVG
jgi:hypothetical protein